MDSVRDRTVSFVMLKWTAISGRAGDIIELASGVTNV